MQASIKTKSGEFFVKLIEVQYDEVSFTNPETPISEIVQILKKKFIFQKVCYIIITMKFELNTK